MTLAEHELWSTITHWFGAIVFAFYGFYLTKNAPKSAQSSIRIFSICSVMVLFASGLYHIMPQGVFKKPFQILDHCAIFLLMGATYQVCYDLLFHEIVSLKIKKVCFISFWSLIVTFIAFKIFFWSSISETVSLSLYLFGGWLAIISSVVFLRHAQIKTLLLIGLGIILYTIGAVIDYKKWGTSWIDAHVIFHVFVLVALFTHYEFVRKSIKVIGQSISHEIINTVDDITHVIQDLTQDVEDSKNLEQEKVNQY